MLLLVIDVVVVGDWCCCWWLLVLLMIDVVVDDRWCCCRWCGCGGCLWSVFVVVIVVCCCCCGSWLLVAGRWSLVVVQKTVQTRCIYTIVDTTLGKKGEKHEVFFIFWYNFRQKSVKTRGFCQLLRRFWTKIGKNTGFSSTFDKVLDEN